MTLPGPPPPPGSIPTWEEVARTQGRFMYAVAYRLAGNQTDAEDVVQEALVRVKRGLDGYTPGSLQGWLARIVTNVFLDETRRRTRRPQVALPDDPDRVIPGAPGADEQLALDTLPDHLRAALADLPTDYRVAVVLCDVVGLTYGEVAEHTGVPIGTVRSRVHRGRMRLREVLT
ncbi:MAG: sigma-70 family RNA polymerase sigma factor [Acidimicrobiales bacterium]